MAGVHTGRRRGRGSGGVSLPLSAAPDGIGTPDLCRDEPGVLSELNLADALIAADIARDAVLSLQEPPGNADMAVMLDLIEGGPACDPPGDRHDRCADERDDRQRSGQAAGGRFPERMLDL